MGQIVREVERAAKGCAQVKLVPHAGGDLHDEATILKAVQEGLR
jgi:hypothetical protein